MVKNVKNLFKIVDYVEIAYFQKKNNVLSLNPQILFEKKYACSMK